MHFFVKKGTICVVRGIFWVSRSRLRRYYANDICSDLDNLGNLVNIGRCAQLENIGASLLTSAGDQRNLRENRSSKAR